MMKHLFLSFCLLIMGSVGSAEDSQPHSLDPDVVIELFAEHPQLVTPTGLAVDDQGRVFVAESHTHFRPDDYDGPKADRILILEDKDGDGQTDARTIFHEGFTHIMDLAFHQDGSLYVATRKDIHRMRDTDGDNQADEVKRIINLETEGNYPHNGISGLAFHLDGQLSFGLGENLGADYAIVGTDDKRFTGGGEGGSTYRVNADGTNLRRVSTGWWNPFGMCVDAFDRVFGTDNDPGASPPCRLHQVIEGGDYGYEYRYGRTGLHPLISWTGSNPGNLPMISGTGEAPCAVMAYESDALPKKYLGRLLVASWADHRIEHYKITQPKNQGLVTTKREILIEAQNGFRPVDLALAPDGTVYVTDWVSSSYTLHKQGRIWRIRPKNFEKPRRPEDTKDALQSLHRPLREEAARKLVADMTANDSLTDLLSKQSDSRVKSALIQAWAANHKLAYKDFAQWLQEETDLRLKQLGVRLLAEQGQKVLFENWKTKPAVSVKAAAIIAGSADVDVSSFKSDLEQGDPLLFHAFVTYFARQTATDRHVVMRPDGSAEREAMATVALLSIRRCECFDAKERDVTLKSVLDHCVGDARFAAIKWIADEQLKKFRAELVKLLDDPHLDYRTFRAVAAAIDRLDGKKPSDHPSPQFLLDRLTAEKSSPALLQVALREIDPTFKKLQLDHLVGLLSHEDPKVRLEAVRTLTKHPDGNRYQYLMQIANDEKQPIEHRATAIAGLADGGANETAFTVLQHALGENAVLQDEALRALVGVKFDENQLAQISTERIRQSLQRLAKGKLAERPDVQDLEAWRKLLQGEGDPKAGERIFFGTKVGTCSRCHQIEGRGTAVGPDLTQIARRLESQNDPTEWLLKTILRPSEDMAPQYTPWIILTTGGETLTGLPRRKGGNQEAYLGIDGKEFTVNKSDIEFHKESDTSLMPQDLLQNLTDQELRDLFAFLRQER